MDRLSVRTELTAPTTLSNPASGAGVATSGGQRKPLSMTEEEAANVAFNPASLYFSPAESELLGESKQPLEETPVKPSAKCIQDSIMRHMNRELTPSISELYHERSLGLGLAPPLSKLLLNPNYEEQEVTTMVESSSQSAGTASAATPTSSSLSQSGSRRTQQAENKAGQRSELSRGTGEQGARTLHGQVKCAHRAYRSNDVE